MGTHPQRSRSRASREPYHDYKDGHIVQRRITPATIDMLVRIYSRRRYATPEYVAALLGLDYNSTIVRFKALRELSMRVLKLCEKQETNLGDRLVGYLYSELDTEGYSRNKRL